MKFQPLRAIRTMFGYDAIQNKGRRNAVVVSSKSEDRELNSSDRKILTSNAEDQRRNIALCRWMINKHLDFVTKFSIQVRTGDQDLNKEIERLLRWWSRPTNCDVGGRHSFQSMIRTLESLAVVTGDAAISKLSSGKIQGIEGTRIATPSRGDIPEELTKAKTDRPSRLTQGILHDGASRALKYVVNRRVRDGLEYETTLSANDVEFHGYFDRFDQIRGVSPIAAALNVMRDLYEGFEYALFKAKYHAFFGVAIYSDGSMEDDYFRQDEIRDKDTDGDDDIDTDDQPRYEFKLNPGLKLELEKGDKVDTIESKTPSSEFQNYSVLMIQIALLALDIPLTFFDSRKSSFSASRSDMSLYMESVERKRAALHEVIRNIVYWKLGQWTRRPDGSPLLTLPDGMEIRDIEIDIISTGTPWIDPMKEVAAGAKEIAIAVNSRQRYCRERGRDFWTIIDELEAEEKALVDRGITVEVATPGALTTRDEEGSDNAANTADDTDAPDALTEAEEIGVNE